ncbi:hypothetical protein FB451DRAFT_580392 [Mycena latifolia]|nr:hypothetical protein FB451DRAFT_580392 [Mycena latifolia]
MTTRLKRPESVLSKSFAQPHHLPLPRFPDEIILEIFEHLTDAELLSLAAISKHIHELALLAHFSRHGITESDIASHSFPQLSTTGAFRAFRIARFITGIEALRLRFDPSAQLHQHVRALADLSRRLPPIKSIDLEFIPWPARAQIAAVRLCDMEGLILTLISAYRSRPSVVVSPLTVSIIRPKKPAFYGVRWMYSGMRALGSQNYVRSAPLIEEQQFRQEFVIVTLMRAGGAIPNVSIRAFDAPDALGTLIVVRASGVSDLRFPSNLGLSTAEMSAIFARLKLPLLRGVEASLWNISPPALRAFLIQHPSLQRLRFPGTADPPRRANASARAPRDLLPPDALPELEHIFGSATLLAWVLASPQPFTQLTSVTVELHSGASTREHYHAALRGMVRRPALRTFSLQLYGWVPWAKKNFDPSTAPEREVAHVADLRLTFRALPGVGPNIAPLAQWLKLFRGVREVSFFDHVPLKNLCPLLAEECPQIKFISYKLGK